MLPHYLAITKLKIGGKLIGQCLRWAHTHTHTHRQTDISLANAGKKIKIFSIWSVAVIIPP